MQRDDNQVFFFFLDYTEYKRCFSCLRYWCNDSEMMMMQANVTETLATIKFIVLGGGVVIRALAFYSYDPSLNTAQRRKQIKKRPGLANFIKKLLCLSVIWTSYSPTT